MVCCVRIYVSGLMHYTLLSTHKARSSLYRSLILLLLHSTLHSLFHTRSRIPALVFVHSMVVISIRGSPWLLMYLMLSARCVVIWMHLSHLYEIFT